MGVKPLSARGTDIGKRALRLGRVALVVAVLAALEQPAAADDGHAGVCVMSGSDRSWLEAASQSWKRVSETKLKLQPAPTPTVTVFDARCAYVSEEGAVGQWRGAVHGGQVSLPGGGKVPAGVVSFAAPAGERGFFVMSLPSVWKAAGVKSGMGLEALMTGVFVHEMTHTRQFYFADPRLKALTRTYGLPDDLSDDSLQQALKTEPGYVAAYEAERDLLYAAAAAPNRSEAKRLARLALIRMRARRTEWFVGDRAKWAPLDEVFLTMEGLGQWAAYSALVEKRPAGLMKAQLMIELRRGGRFWSQDSGLALFLVVDRLYPGWQQRAFASEPWTAERLLEAAAR
jgi:hypothetical protein